MLKALQAGNSVLEGQVRQRIENLSFLPTTAAVAIKFIELGRNPEAEPAEYAKVISSDPSLSTKLLALANSSWFGVRNKITKPNLAVNLLGLGTVRTLAISYCLTGLHNDLKLGADESRMFWSAGICKAVAAKLFARHFDEKLAEEAFAAGLFQDFALTVMYATAREIVLPLMGDVSLDWRSRLDREREIFRLDHAEIGRLVAQKLELPDVFVDGVAFHHNHESLVEFLETKIIADAIYVAGLFPHTLDAWNPSDAAELQAFVTRQSEAGGKPLEINAFLGAVQQEFEQLYAYFETGPTSPLKLTEMLSAATQEVAETTTRLVGSVQTLLSDRACLAGAGGVGLSLLLEERKQLDDPAQRDLLTGLLNRSGLASRAMPLIGKATRASTPVSTAIFSVDRFEQLSARHEAYGEHALKKLAEFLQDAARGEDLVARIDTAKLVLLTFGRGAEEMDHVVGAIHARFGKEPLNKGTPPIQATLSAGLFHAPLASTSQLLDALLAEADKPLDAARMLGGNRVQSVPRQPRQPASVSHA